MDTEDPPHGGGGGRTPGEVIDIMSSIAARLGDSVRDSDTGPAPAPVRADAPAEPPAVPATIRPAALVPSDAGPALDAPLRTLMDGFAMWGRAVHDAAGQHVQALARNVDDLARKADGAEAAVRDLARRAQGAEVTAADAGREAREAHGRLAEVGRLLAEHAEHLARLEAGAEADAAQIAGLRAANAKLASRLAWRTGLAAMALVAIVAAALWLKWPAVVDIVAVLSRH